jgi:iron complex transport system ATP-binding protein
MIVQVEGLRVRYPGVSAPALDGVDLRLEPGELLALAGPNGSGKTTLVRALLGLVERTGGSVLLRDRSPETWRARELAGFAAMVPQREETPFSWRVEEMVSFGRYARLGPLSPLGPVDREAVSRALDRCDIGDLVGRRVETLSGGEWQRVRIARALAQEPSLLILDEPTAALDLRHAMELFELVRKLVAEGLTALVATHELNLAARYASRMLLLHHGRVAAVGAPGEVMREGPLSEVFGWPVTVVRLPEGAPQVVPLRHYS